MHGVPALVPATLKWEKALNGIASPPAVWVQMHACHMFRQRKLHPRNPWVKPPVCMYSPEKNPWGFVFVLTHFSVDTLTGRELRASLLQSPTQSRDSLRSGQVDKSYLSYSLLDLESFLRWRLCALSGSLSQCLTFSGEMFSLASTLRLLCFNLHLFSHSSLCQACLFLMGSCWKLWNPSKPSPPGAEQSLLELAFCRGVPHCPDTASLGKLHFIQGSLHWGVQKTVDDV